MTTTADKIYTPHQAAQEIFEQAPKRYAHAIRAGYWPSDLFSPSAWHRQLSVLPQSEARRIFESALCALNRQ